MAQQEIIEIVARFINEMTAPVRQVQQNLEKLEMQTKAYQNVATNAGVSVGKASRYFKDNNLAMQDSETAVNNLTGQTYSLGQVTDNVSKSAKRFNFAWLSVMFAGMALNRVFGSLVKSQLQLFGITELYGGVLTLIMLPVMTTLLPLFLELAMIFMNLPDGVKEVIGWFIVFMAVLGLALFVLGSLQLAAMGLGSIFGVTTTFAMAGIVGVVVMLLGLALLIVGIGDIIKFWGKDWVKVLKGVGLAFTGLSAIAIVAFGIMQAHGVTSAAVTYAAWTGGISLIIAAFAFLVAYWMKNNFKMKQSTQFFLAVVQNLFWGFFNAVMSRFGTFYNFIVDRLNNIGGVLGLSFERVDVEGLKHELNDLVYIATMQKEKLREYEEALKAETEISKITGDFDATMKELQGNRTLTLGEQDVSGLIPTSDFYGTTREAVERESQNEISINMNNTFNVSDKEEMEKMLNENNIKLSDEINRLIGV